MFSGAQGENRRGRGITARCARGSRPFERSGPVASAGCPLRCAPPRCAPPMMVTCRSRRPSYRNEGGGCPARVGLLCQQGPTSEVSTPLISSLAPSSRGRGHHPLKVETRVRIPLGLLSKLHASASGQLMGAAGLPRPRGGPGARSAESPGPLARQAGAAAGLTAGGGSRPRDAGPTDAMVGELLERWQATEDFSPKTVLETRGFLDRNCCPRWDWCR